MVHGDIKLGNILITTQDLDNNTICKLSDFGMTVDISANRKSLGGTPFYQSVESLGFNPIVGTHGDIWSLGVILYTLLVGYPPF